MQLLLWFILFGDSIVSLWFPPSRVLELLFYLKVSQLKQPVYVWIEKPTGWELCTTTELDLNSFRPSPFRELVCHLSTQANNGLLDIYIAVFEQRRDKRRCFIPYLVYSLVYTSIASKHVTLATLSPRSDSVCARICSPFSRKPLSRRPRMVKTRLLINW